MDGENYRGGVRIFKYLFIGFRLISLRIVSECHLFLVQFSKMV